MTNPRGLDKPEKLFIDPKTKIQASEPVLFKLNDD
jgi:hypothetical protein